MKKIYHNWIKPIFSISNLFFAFPLYKQFFYDLNVYKKLPNAEKVSFKNLLPEIYDRTTITQFDHQYFYVNAWAFRKVTKDRSSFHVDVGSQIQFVSLLSSVKPVLFLDYRPLIVSLENLYSSAGDILHLPIKSNSIYSLSCLHVAEHIGLGRYGDPLDPLGTYKAINELIRVLAPGGSLFFAVPIGKPRLCFNAHRIHSPQQILNYFSDLELIEFSGVDDQGSYYPNSNPMDFDNQNYACGFFHFVKV